jgi:hypothetical protein
MVKIKNKFNDFQILAAMYGFFCSLPAWLGFAGPRKVWIGSGDCRGGSGVADGRWGDALPGWLWQPVG